MNDLTDLYKDKIPSVRRRILAKFIDLLGLAGTVSGAILILGSDITGVLIGYSWFLLIDWLGGFGKSFLKMKTINLETGLECTFIKSIQRNAILIFPALLVRLHQSFLGLLREEYRNEYPLLIFLNGLIVVIILFVELLQMYESEIGQRYSDNYAKTVVVMKK